MPNALIEIDRMVGDRLTPFAAQLYQGGSAVNLTGKTVAFHMVKDDNTVKVNEAAATVDVAASGKVSYQPLAADVDTVGVYYGWWIVTQTATSLKDTFPNDGRKYKITFHEKTVT